MKAEEAKKLKKRILANVFYSKNLPRVGYCWLWLGSKAGKGYPVFKVGGKRVSVRRLAFLLYTGVKTKKALWAKCGCSDCVNPSHMSVNNRLKGGRPKEN